MSDAPTSSFVRRPGLWVPGVTLLAALGPALLVYVGVLPPAGGLLGVFALMACVCWLLRRHVAGIGLVFAVVGLISTITTDPWLAFAPPASRHSGALSERWRQQGPFDERLPIVVHILLDEMMSPGAVEPDLPRGPSVQMALRNFGAAQGFRVYDSVYSRFFFSGISTPNLMGPEFEGRTGLNDVVKEIQAEIPVNPYFNELAQRGYRTAVFQSALLGYCLSPTVKLCHTFPSFDPTAVDTDPDEKTRHAKVWESVLRAFEPSHVSSAAQRIVRRFYGLGERPIEVLGVADRYDVQGFPAWFDQLETFLRDVPRGTHVFAHLMVPHAPYLLTNRCVVSGTIDSGYYLAERFTDDAEREQNRREYYDRYFAQAECVLDRVNQLMATLLAQPAFRDATIIVHGDHGSRISRGELHELLGPRDYLDNYATFFALRAPGVEPGLDCQQRSLSEVFRSTITGAAAPVSDPLPVLVKSRAGEQVFVEEPMPPFGCAVEPVRTE